MSLRDYLDLVVNNNTDIGIQRLTLETPMNAIQRAAAIYDPTITASYSATRAIQSYRKAVPTGEGGLKDVSSKGGK